MKRMLSAVLLTTLFAATAAEAARVRVRKGVRGRTTVTVRTVRPAPVVRVRARTWLPRVAFTAAVVASLPADGAWHASEAIERREGWTDFTMNVDRRGTRLLLEIDRGAAQLHSAEVVFEDGTAQAVDFDDTVHRTGIYELLDFRNGRKVDHVRIVARASAKETKITVHLVS